MPNPSGNDFRHARKCQTIRETTFAFNGFILHKLGVYKTHPRTQMSSFSCFFIYPRPRLAIFFDFLLNRGLGWSIFAVLYSSGCHETRFLLFSARRGSRQRKIVDLLEQLRLGISGTRCGTTKVNGYFGLREVESDGAARPCRRSIVRRPVKAIPRHEF